MAAGCTGRIFIDPLCLPRRRCPASGFDLSLSLSATEIAIFIHKPRLERAHRAHNKARGLLDRLTLLHPLRREPLQPDFGNTARGKISRRATSIYRRTTRYIIPRVASVSLFPPITGAV